MASAMDALELTEELIAWQGGKDPMAVIPALLVTAAKIAGIAAISGDSDQLEKMISLLRITFMEERDKYKLTQGKPN